MRYVHVAGKHPKSAIDFTPGILRQTGYCLYSLIEGLRQKDFSLLSLAGVMESIQEYNSRYVKPVNGQLFADSGGYSIIVGEVHPINIAHFIQCYSCYLEHERNCYGRIFSLDIPLSLGYPSMNTKTNILNFNMESMKCAKEVLLSHPEIQDKYHFVWHFKMPSQYEIWKQLYADLSLNKIIRHRAIGGMVGIRKATGIKFSPFTGITYRCFNDYIAAGKFEHPFSVHFLGMYTPVDRFQIALLEGIFRYYLAGVAEVEFTYDSISHSQAARMTSKLPLYRFNNEVGLVTYPELTFATDAIMKEVYTDHNIIAFVMEEFIRRQNGERLHHSNTFAPLNIFSNLQLDSYFDSIVKDLPFVELLSTESSLTKIDYHLRNCLDGLGKQYPKLFTRTMAKGIQNNIDMTFTFQRWLVKGHDEEHLDELMADVIRKIGFPADLS